MTPHQAVLTGNALDLLPTLEADSIHAIVTSPPYYRQRDYGHRDQFGQESTVEAYVANLVAVFRELRRVLRTDGSAWLNLGDTYRDGQLLGVPWRVALALQADGWILRQDVIWHKPAPMPESVRDRCTRAHEYLFLLAKSTPYHFDDVAIHEPATAASPGNKTPIKGATTAEYRPRANLHKIEARQTRNRRSVWRAANTGYRGAHFAVMPRGIVEPCILASVPALACPLCGKGYGRIVERRRTPTRPGTASKAHAPDAQGNRDARRHVTETVTTGFRPACDHPQTDEPAAGTVLDPFMGSGTVPAVAAELGRHAIGIELNPAYVALARERLEATTRRQGG